VLLGTTVAALALAAPAQAGTYTVYGCSTPNGAAAPIDGWSGSVDLGPLRAGVDGRNACCGADPRMTMEHVTAPGAAREWDRASNATWTFSAPAGTQIEAVTLSRRFSTYGGYAIAWEVYDRQGRREVCFHAGGGCAALGTVGRYAAVRH